MAFDPTNPLEESLVAAVHDPACRPQFYRDLLESEIYAIQEGVPESEGKVTLAEDTEVRLRMIEWNGKPFIPIFTSLERLQTVLQDEVGFLSLNALQFMQITQGADLVLNPGSDYGKEFLKDEVASILDGSIWNPGEQRQVEADTKVLLSQPAEPPTELMNALSRLFEKTPGVLRGYVCLVAYEADIDSPHTLLAIEAEGDWDEIVASAGMIVREVACPNPPIDVIRITGLGGIEDYFKDNTPFYLKKGMH